MRYCTACGMQIPDDSQFCENCGAALQPLPSMPLAGTPGIPSPRPPAGPPSARGVPRHYLLPLGIVAFLILAAVAYLIVLPLVLHAPGTASSSTPVAAITSIPVTPPAATRPLTATPTPVPSTPVIRTEGRYEEQYQEIFLHNQEFRYGQTISYLHDLTRPPLYIKFNLTPVMIVRHRMVDIGLASERMINTTNPSPNAWFEVRVRDTATGTVLDTQGYGRDFSDHPKQEFMVRQPGNYTVEMAGHDVAAEVQMLIGT